MQCDGFQLLVRLTQALAKKANGRARNLWIVRDELAQCLLREGHGDDRPDRSRAGRPLATIQRCDLAKELSGPGMRERQLSPFGGQNRKPDASLEHEVNLLSRVPARE